MPNDALFDNPMPSSPPSSSSKPLSYSPYTSLSSDLVTVKWENNVVKLIDQTRLPETLQYITCKNHEEVANAIKSLSIRGAPAIGVAAAMGLALCAINSTSNSKNDLLVDLQNAYNVLFKTRPTAINLKWGLDKIIEEAYKYPDVSRRYQHKHKTRKPWI
jgi:methylthioribose-1-phosphate isomerase